MLGRQGERRETRAGGAIKGWLMTSTRALERKIALPILGPEYQRQLSPTDISQFIRLEQCQRYLRLRLHEHAVDRHFMRDYDVVPQSIPPLLTRSGATFEALIEGAVRERFAAFNFATEMTRPRGWLDDNARAIAEARALAPGQTVILFQPRIRAILEGWQIRGDVDILRLERDAAGELQILIADMKSSTSAKVEHRLQVAFYHEMIARLFADAGLAHAAITLAILYRGPAGDDTGLSPQEVARREEERDRAAHFFGTRAGLLEIVADPEAYRGAVRDLVTGADSTADRAANAPFEALPYHLTYKCDGCVYNEFCMKWSAERDDLSLLPHLTEHDKSALHRAGVDTVRALALVKDLVRPADPATTAKATAGAEPVAARPTLVPAPGQEALARRLAATWPVGPRLDELIHRAHRYRKWKRDPAITDALSYIPSKGYGSLPYTDAEHNPNLVRVYIDAQHDYLHDRLYLLGALVVACEGGEEVRRRAIVQLTDGPPDDPAQEEALLTRWIGETIGAIATLAGDDEAGGRRAPIHLIFYNGFEQRLLLDGLARHFAAILGATPLYDFLTQLAAFDSPLATFLDQEIRELKNYPMVCQSLQAVAAYRKFDWNAPEPYRDIFRSRLFDFWGKLDRPEGETPQESPWYTNHARFNSQIPLEYAYAAWGELPGEGGKDQYARYRGATTALLVSFQERRLEALEWVASDFTGNQQTSKRAFDLPNLAAFTEKARTLAGALAEFVTIERHAAISAWKGARLAPPERRALTGETLIVRYLEGDQGDDVAARNRENLRRHELQQVYRAAWQAAHPDATQVRLPKDQREESDWSQAGLRFRLRLDCAALDCGLDEALALTTIRPGDRLVLFTRTAVDERLPTAEQVAFQPTAKQLLYGMRVDLERIVVERDGDGRATNAWAAITVPTASFARDTRGFVFSGRGAPFEPEQCYTLDPDPNDWYGSFCADIAAGLRDGEPNTLYRRLIDPASAHVAWSPDAAAGQARFLAGLAALREAGALHDFEESKRDFIGGRGTAPTLLVQGPPGTGKSYSTAFALFARLQGALAAGREYRVFLSCKTHAATDVLLQNVVAVQERLRQLLWEQPALFAAHFDARLLDVPLFRAAPRGATPDGASALPRDNDRPSGTLRVVDRLLAAPACVVAATPAGIRALLKDKWPKALFGHELCDCLVLDEASQMNLPEACMAALPLRADGQLIVVGDHRQMPPIVKHDWAGERRRTFQEFRSYESLFLALLPLGLPLIQFAESFRLHADMAEFLRREVYAQDGIAYHSNRHESLPAYPHDDPFVAATLAPDYPLIVVVHDEDRSQQRNPFERELIAPILEALADPATYALGPEHGLGVVVPHRAQRADLRERVPALAIVDPETGAVVRSAVDTVERFQGGERHAILVSATESDREYLLTTGDFLLDPRRLTVALSRAKEKLILVASRAVFEVFSADEETFAHAQIWKNLLRHTCTVPLWTAERDGYRVTVWGNVPTPDVIGAN